MDLLLHGTYAQNHFQGEKPKPQLHAAMLICCNSQPAEAYLVFLQNEHHLCAISSVQVIL